MVEKEDFGAREEAFFTDIGKNIEHILSDGDVSLSMLEEILTDTYKEVADRPLDNIFLWLIEGQMFCVVMDNYGEVTARRKLESDASSMLMQRFGKELEDKALDRMVSDLLDRIQPQIDQLICDYAKKCKQPGLQQVMEDIGKQMEGYIGSEVPGAVGKISVEITMPDIQSLKCYVSLGSNIPYEIEADKGQAEKAAGTVIAKAEELFQGAWESFFLNIEDHIRELAAMPMALETLQTELLRRFCSMTARKEQSDYMMLFAEDGAAGFIYFEGVPIAASGMFSDGLSKLLIQRFGEQLYDNAKSFGEEIKESGWKDNNYADYGKSGS
ncbi:MAG: hypothetical protein NC548_35305 [Lachnospiraceae bacterium]|nr:hypothetical protein [Lachnospiraceae bacterium]